MGRSVDNPGLFNDAPRALRIEAVEKLPELFENLIKEAAATIRFAVRRDDSSARGLLLTRRVHVFPFLFHEIRPLIRARFRQGLRDP